MSRSFKPPISPHQYQNEDVYESAQRLIPLSKKKRDPNSASPSTNFRSTSLPESADQPSKAAHNGYLHRTKSSVPLNTLQRLPHQLEKFQSTLELHSRSTYPQRSLSRNFSHPKRPNVCNSYSQPASSEDLSVPSRRFKSSDSSCSPTPLPRKGYSNPTMTSSSTLSCTELAYSLRLQPPYAAFNKPLPTPPPPPLLLLLFLPLLLPLPPPPPPHQDARFERFLSSETSSIHRMPCPNQRLTPAGPRALHPPAPLHMRKPLQIFARSVSSSIVTSSASGFNTKEGAGDHRSAASWSSANLNASRLNQDYEAAVAKHESCNRRDQGLVELMVPVAPLDALLVALAEVARNEDWEYIRHHDEEAVKFHVWDDVIGEHGTFIKGMINRRVKSGKGTLVI